MPFYTCSECGHSLASHHFDAAETGGFLPFCRVCVAKKPQLGRAVCRACGVNRKIGKFPNCDPTSPCLGCEPVRDTEVVRALSAAVLVPGKTKKTVRELLEMIGFKGAPQRDVLSAGRFLRAQGFTPCGPGPVQQFALTVPPADHDPEAYPRWYDLFPKGPQLIGVEDGQHAKYLDGAVVPITTRYAMTAVATGLPAWGDEPCSKK